MTAPEDIYAADLADEIARKVIQGLPDTRPLLTVEQAAERLGMKSRSVFDLMKAGQLPWVQMGRPGSPGSRKIEQAAIDAFIAERRTEVDPEEGPEA